MSDRRLYAAGDASILEPLDCAIERAEDNGAAEITEMRPSSMEDVDYDDLTDCVWVWLDEYLMEDEMLAHADGSARLDQCVYRRAKGDRPKAWHTLWAAIRRVLIDHGDFSEAAWTDVRTLTLNEARTLRDAAEAARIKDLEVGATAHCPLGRSGPNAGNDGVPDDTTCNQREPVLDSQDDSPERRAHLLVEMQRDDIERLERALAQAEARAAAGERAALTCKALTAELLRVEEALCNDGESPGAAAERWAREHDEAAGDLPVDLPEPGSDAAKLMTANRLLRAALNASEDRVSRYAVSNKLLEEDLAAARAVLDQVTVVCPHDKPVGADCGLCELHGCGPSDYRTRDQWRVHDLEGQIAQYLDALETQQHELSAAYKERDGMRALAIQSGRETEELARERFDAEERAEKAERERDEAAMYADRNAKLAAFEAGKRKEAERERDEAIRVAENCGRRVSAYIDHLRALADQIGDSSADLSADDLRMLADEPAQIATALLGIGLLAANGDCDE